MLNLMVGLGGYTLCSGIISQAMNGNDFTAIPFQEDEEKSQQHYGDRLCAKKEYVSQQNGGTVYRSIKRSS